MTHSLYPLLGAAAENQGILWLLGAVLTGIIAGLSMAVLHYAIDRARGGDPMPRIWAYITGVLILHLSYSAWLLWSAPPLGYALAGLWIIAVLAGAADIACYALDAWVEKRVDRAELEARREAEKGR